MHSSNSHKLSAGALDRDLYCPGCGYNLRGLPGVVVRCPECARESSTEELEIPAAIIRRTLNELESATAYSLLCLLALIGMAFFAAFDRSFWNLSQEWLLRWMLFLLAIAGGLALALFLSRRSCQNHPDWPAALFRYHLFGGLMLAGAIATFGAILWITAEAGQVRRGAPTNLSQLGRLWLVALLVLIGVFVLWARFTYRLATKRLRELQRDVAVRIAQRELERHRSRG